MGLSNYIYYSFMTDSNLPDQTFHFDTSNNNQQTKMNLVTNTNRGVLVHRAGVWCLWLERIFHWTNYSTLERNSHQI